ncbi:hypothetical protein BC943DRAFT_326920 [Umbelopsis sp. AD052]|nr:hypothetical protein BC943DRAFT_326920 [Umbelopsis sp. AD052]
MFSTNKTNFLIIDTCTLLQCGDLILTMLTIIRKKKLKFIIVIPTIVVIELKGQEYNRTGLKQLDIYLS